MEQVSVQQVYKAIDALQKNLKNERASQNANLLGEDEYFWLVLGLKKISEKTKVNPILLPVKHSFKKNFEVCLFTKDPQKEYKLKVKEMKFISKVIGISKLKLKYRPFEAKRQLCAGFDTFLADDRIIHLLPSLLGKTFFEKKKTPIPVNLKNTLNLEKELKNAVDSTTLILNKGPCASIKIASCSQQSKEIEENLFSVLKGLIEKVPGGFENIQSLNLKTNSSISLPIYNSLPAKDSSE